jgi:flagellar assembly protein FliH
MSSSSSAFARGLGGVARDDRARPTPARSRVIRGVSFERGASPLEAELPGPAPVIDPVAAEAQVRRGYDDGYQAGLVEGLASGRAAMAAESAAAVARLEAAAGALAAAAADLRHRQALELTGLEDALARAAVDLASAIIGRELEVSASPGADALARALALVPAGSSAVARLHPADAAVLAEAPLDGAGALTVIPDPAVEPGGCILEVGDSRIDAQLGSALDRVRSALLADRPSRPGSRPGSGR